PPTDAGLRMDADVPGKLFFAAADGYKIVTVLQLVQVIDILIPVAGNGLGKEQVVLALDGDRDGVSSGIQDGDMEFHVLPVRLADADLQAVGGSRIKKIVQMCDRSQGTVIALSGDGVGCNKRK